MGRSLTLAVMPLAVAETLIWAALFYSFPAMLPVWEADFGWSRAEISGAMTASMIATAILSPFAGRLIDRGHQRSMFLGCVAAGALLLVLLSQVQTLWQFWIVWILIGAVNAAILYEACFSIITVVTGPRARDAITVVTLVAGFAGTVCFPAFHALSETVGWRGATLVFAGVTLVLSLPLSGLGFKLLEAHRAPPETGAKSEGSGGAAIARTATFRWIALGFSCAGLVHGMVISHIRPILEECGLAATMAVLVASMMGPMQVVGRVIMVSLRSRIDAFGAAMGSFSGILLGLLLLLLAARYWPLAFLFVLPYSAAYGIISIVRPVIAAEFLGRAGFGVIAGMLALPYVLAGAAGPILSAGLWSVAGYDLVLVLSGGLIAVSAGCLLAARASLGSRPSA